jgi:glycosyltransferase 2 family protein
MQLFKKWYARAGKSGRFSIKLALSSILTFLIIKKIDIKEIGNVFGSAQLSFIGIAILGMIIDRFLMAYRWSTLISAVKISIPIRKILRIYFLGAFAGNFLPSSIAPDAVRVYYAAKFSPRIGYLVSSVVLDRLLGIFSLCVVVLFSISYIYLIQKQADIQIGIVVIFCLITIFILYHSDGLIKLFNSDKLGWATEKLEGSRIRKLFINIYTAWQEYKRHRKAILKTLFISFGNHILSIVGIYALSLSIDMHVSILYLFLIVPLIVFLLMLPVSIGGIGVQEGGFVFFLNQVGVSSEQALTLALLFRIATIIVSLPGGIYYAIERGDAKEMSKMFKQISEREDV